VLARQAANRDVIVDFVQGQDKLAISASLFGPQFTVGSSLADAQLVASANPVALAAGVATLLFSTSTGVLRFDADGAGGAAAVQIATLQGTRAVDTNDFVIV
jgi:Ca2+-binding RTX toxin-like protein